MADNGKIASDVLKAVGGAENVMLATHCMTRLRLNLKDDSLAEDEVLKRIDGVLGIARSGGQTQIIIGQNVPKVYAAFCEAGGIQGKADEADVSGGPGEKLTLKKVGMNILNYLAGSLTPLIPILIGAAMFKTILSIVGPDMLGLFSLESDLYRLFDFVYDAGFYFLPIFIGYTAAKKIGASPILGMFMGGILLAPDFMAMSAEGTAFTVFGIPCVTNDYSQSVLPIILSVWILKYVEGFFKKHIPDALSTIFIPFLTMLLMLPLSLCALAPLGVIAGQYIAKALISFGDVGGFVAVAVIAMLWEFLVMSGMHVVMVVTVLNAIMTTGYDTVIWPAALCATVATSGMALGAFLRMKDKREKSLCLGYFISGIVGGVTEPSLYGLGFKYKKPFIGLMIGAALGGAYAGITHAYTYSLGATNFLMVLSFAGAGTANLVNGVIAWAIALAGAAAATCIIGFDEQGTNEETREEADEGTVLEDIKEVKACISGRAVPASEIRDETFSSGIMGQGIGIIPTDQVITAPCDAEVTTVMEDSRHAVGLRLSNGADILIHEGLDTVALNGEGFRLFVKEGDQVKAGDKLIAFDSEFVKSKGYDTICVFLVTNSDEFEGLEFTTGEDVTAGESVVMKF